ncbi:MAG: hypothetical protein GY804_15065, partial [Alphaproteobacteria bacterium]|nr:hypothetical protein [Alphaproteobacteria bacterium]
MRLQLKAANKGQITTEAPSLAEQLITFAAVKTIEATKATAIFLSETPKKINEKIISSLNKNKKGELMMSPENGDMIHRNVIDALHVPAVITRLSDSRVMYYNKKAQDKFGMTDLCVVKMSDLYVNKKDYDN